jgi:hypothetical protein
MNAHLLVESRVYGTWIKGLKLPENMGVELVGRQQISGSEWAIIRFNHQGQSMSGWIPADAVASPMTLKAIPVASFDDTAAVQAQPGFLSAGGGALGISRNEMVGILSPYFPELKSLTRQEGSVRISTATEDQKSSLLMRCDNDKILEVILTLSSEDIQLAQGFSQSLSGHCAATAQSMLDMIRSQESGSLECSEVCQIQVEHSPGSVWIHLKPVGTRAESG